MPNYLYKARDIRGQAISGSIELTDEKAAREYLRVHELFVTSLQEASAAPLQKARVPRRRVKLPDLVVFSRQFASMIKAGVPIMQTLVCLAEQTEHPTLRAALEAVRQDVETGTTLSAAIGRWPTVFPETFVSLVKAGEASGSLESNLEAAAVQFDKEHELQERIQSAFIYPVVMLGATGLVVAVMLTFVVPVFAGIYTSMHAQLPVMTQMLMTASFVLTHYTLVVVAVIGGLVMLLQRYVATDAGRLSFDRLKLRLPIFGKLNRKVAVARFVRVLAALINSGLPLTSALELAAVVSGSRVLTEAVHGVVAEIIRGQSVSDPLERTGEFPKMVIRMVAVGEETGSLPMMLEETAHFYDRDVEYTVKRLTTLLEPLLTAVLAAIVGFVVIALYLPIFGLGHVLAGGK